MGGERARRSRISGWRHWNDGGWVNAVARVVEGFLSPLRVTTLARSMVNDAAPEAVPRDGVRRGGRHVRARLRCGWN
jgi:hypothetical protein